MSRVGPYSHMTGVLLRCHVKAEAQGECHVTIKAGTGMRSFKPETAQGASKLPETRKRQGRIPLQVSKGPWTYLQLDFRILACRT